MHNRLDIASFRYAVCLSMGIWACSSTDDGRDGADDGRPPEAPAPESVPSNGRRPVRLRFEATVGAEPLSCGRSYVSSAGASFTPADLRLFVQDVALIATDGVEQPVTLDVRAPWQLEDVALLDFEDASGACLAGTRELNFEISGSVPEGDYRGLAFTNGVPEADNHADPTLLPPPLQAGSMSWGWLQGYRFLMAEIAAVDAAGGAAPGSALFHLGSTACSGNPSAGGIVCNKPNRNRIRLDDFDPDTDAVVVDIGTLFEGADLNGVTTCHSSGEQCAPFFECAGIDLDDGGASERQALYRVAPARAAAP